MTQTTARIGILTVSDRASRGEYADFDKSFYQKKGGTSPPCARRRPSKISKYR